MLVSLFAQHVLLTHRWVARKGYVIAHSYRAASTEKDVIYCPHVLNFVEYQSFTRAVTAWNIPAKATSMVICWTPNPFNFGGV